MSFSQLFAFIFPEIGCTFIVASLFTLVSMNKDGLDMG